MCEGVRGAVRCDRESGLATCVMGAGNTLWGQLRGLEIQALANTINSTPQKNTAKTSE